MPFVMRDGALAQIERPALPPAPTLTLRDGLTQAYSAIYRTQPSVRTCVGFLARNIAQIGLHLFERAGDDDRRRVTDHDLPALLRAPVPGRTVRYRWLEALVSDLAIYDVAVGVKAKAGGVAPRAVVRVSPELCTPAGETWFGADAVTIRGSKGTVTIPRDQLVLITGYDAGVGRWGSSPIEALRLILDEERSAHLYRDATWRNGARLSGYISRPLDAPAWSKEAKGRFSVGWRSQYAGNGGDVGGTPVLEDGMQFHPAAQTADAAQYVEARKLSREEVASIYYIPPPLVGILDHATFSNIREQHKQLYQDTLGPWLALLQEELQLQLLGDFPDLDPDRHYLEFNIAEKLRGSFEEQAAQLSTSTGAPWLTRNEARARQNLPAIDGGDELVTPLNVLIGGQASPRDSAPPSTGEAAAPPATKGRRVLGKARADDTVTEQATRVLAGFTDRQQRVILSHLGAGKTTLEAVWDGERWDRELAADLLRVNALIATQAGRATLGELGVDTAAWDEDRTLPWLAENAAGVAEGFNGRTRDELAGALDDDDPATAAAALFAGTVAARAAQAAVTQVSAISGFGTTEAVQQVGVDAVKTWRTTSGKPRAAHAAMNGETVPVGALFSNGARWPGDSTLADDNRSGCQCRMDVAVAQEA